MISIPNESFWVRRKKGIVAEEKVLPKRIFIRSLA